LSTTTPKRIFNSRRPNPAGSFARALKLALRALAVILALTLIWIAAAEPPILVTLGAPQTVVTRNPKIGVHTRLTDEVEEWKIKKTLQLVRAMGARWIVEYFPWGYIEPQKGEYDWAHADAVVDHARNQGLTVIARLGFVPEWARPKNSPISLLPEALYPYFGDFVAAFAEHFKGRVDYLIIWNEPNVNAEWGFQPVNPVQYAQLLQIAYPRAHAINPNVKILAGALAPTLAPPGLTDAMGDLEYLQKMYDAGAKDYFDALAIHAYGWTAPADAAPDPNAVNFRRAELVRAVMVANGDAGKHAFITEGGWNDHPRWTKAVRPAARIQNTIRAFEIAQTWDWLDAVCLWAFRFPAPAHTYLDYFTFVTPEFDLKPIYFEVQKYAQGE
jgi:hypothetical protein